MMRISVSIQVSTRFMKAIASSPSSAFSAGPIEISTSLKADRIAFMVKENPNPLAIVADIPAGTQSTVKTRVRMGKTTQVMAVVSADGKLYTASKEVKVTIGGCGG